MQHVKLGQSDLMVSPLTLGCWSFGGDKESYWGEQSQSEVEQIVGEALDLGVNFFDTAFGYNDGRSEISLGKALAGKRSQAVICNKIPIQKTEDLADYPQTIQNSLTRLQTDHIDLMMIHWPTKDEALLRANLAALAKEKERGTIRHIGVSNFAVDTLEIARSMGIQVVANEFAYNLVSRGIEKDVLPYCRLNHISVAAYMPLMQGILTGKYHTLEEIPAVRRRSIHFNSKTNSLARHGGNGTETELQDFLLRLGEISELSGVSTARLAISWLTAKEGVSTIIAGCRSLDQLRENVAAVETRTDPAIVSVLDQASWPIQEKLVGILDLWNLGEGSRIW
ncbi:MAG TPA: aldo/keto reductase [Clostridia bacterium]